MQKKPHNIGEELIKPAATRMTEIMCGKEQAAKLGMVPLSIVSKDGFEEGGRVGTRVDHGSMGHGSWVMAS